MRTFRANPRPILGSVGRNTLTAIRQFTKGEIDREELDRKAAEMTLFLSAQQQLPFDLNPGGDTKWTSS